MKTVLVTGSAGFIGSMTVLELLKDADVRVVGIDNFDDTYERTFKEEHMCDFVENKRYVHYEVDIRNLVELQHIFKKEKPTHLVHLAAKADTRASLDTPQIYIDTNVTGSLNLLELAKEYGLKNCVIASSSSVYGNNERTPWKENDHDIQPIALYGVTKYAVEHMAYTYHKHFDISCTLLRYFNVYGEHNRPGMVPYKWAEAMLADAPIEISGDGERKRDYTYIGDIVGGTIQALWKPLGYEVINLGYGSPLSLNELLKLFEDATGRKAQVTSRPSHAASVETTYADTTKAKALLGWEPKISHEEGISRLLTWFRRHRLKDSA